MHDAMTACDATLWLPRWAALREQLTPSMALHRLACRADRVAVEPGDAARLARSFDILPRGLPIAALTRQLDAGDAMHFTWLRADPGHVRPDMATVRLMACGNLGLSPDECEALLKPLKPLFGDEGFPISAPVPQRWYLCLPPDVRLPGFASPQDVLGDDLFAHLPDGDAGRRWRRLMNEAQVILHNHPVNGQRAREGKLPVNTVWFWGAGRLPDHVRSKHSTIVTDDALITALSREAGVDCETFENSHSQVARLPTLNLARMEQEWDDRFLRNIQLIGTPEGVLFDCRGLRNLELFDRWLVSLLGRMNGGKFDALMLDFGDGLTLRWRAAHRWRFWRRQLPA